MNVFIFLFIFFTRSATLKVKSGLSTVNNISGLKSITALTVSLIFFIYLEYV